MTLSTKQAQTFYDRFGKKQDAQAFYEDKAIKILLDHADFKSATTIYEFGCGTGRFAEDLLEKVLQPSSQYIGIDISQTMVSLTKQRLAKYESRARVDKSDGSIHINREDDSVDRVVSNYVLDLLSDADIKKYFSEAHRVLKNNGKLCLVSLTNGSTLLSKLVSTLWKNIFKINSVLLGGCRPISLESYLDRTLWSLEYRQIVVQFGVPSEVLIARPQQRSNAVK